LLSYANPHSNQPTMSMRVAITGATGYVGSRITAFLRRHHCEVIPLVRDPAKLSDPRSTKFELGQPPLRGFLEGSDALVHCAYDFDCRSSREIHENNVVGSRLLVEEALRCGVERIIAISSASAFPGCRSVYGRTKLDIESIVSHAGGINVRPGLVYGPTPGGVFGAVLRRMQKAAFLPVLAGSAIQRTLHEDDLNDALLRLLHAPPRSVSAPVFLAEEEPRTFRQVLTVMAEAIGRQPVLVPVPWLPAYAFLRLGEGLRLPMPFRSDSLLGLVHGNTTPDFTPAKTLGCSCRAFVATPDLRAAWSLPDAA
jgi:nucleoside-diphosphate-sugar epimerase